MALSFKMVDILIAFRQFHMNAILAYIAIMFIVNVPVVSLWSIDILKHCCNVKGL